MKLLSVLIFLCFIVIILSHIVHISAILPSILMAFLIFQAFITLNQEKRLQQGHIRAMRVLLQQDPPLSQTVDYSHEPLIVLDRNHVIMDVNSLVQNILHLSENLLLGQSIFSILKLPKREFEVWDNFKGELTYTLHSEETLHLSYCIRPLIDQGERTGRIILLTDISEVKKRDEAYLQAAKFSVVGQVAAGLAHELRNPLTTIKGFMQLIGPEQFPEAFRPYHQLILDEIQTTDELIRNFLLLTNPSAPQFKTVHPEVLLQKAIQILQPTLSMNEVTLRLSVLEKIPPILGDEEQLLQALLAIIQNAIEASPQQGEVKLHLVGLDDYLELTIEDQGKGIPDPIRERVFDPFYTTRKEGIGLGLTIAQRILLTHHGKLSIISSSPNSGTVVMLQLPVQKIKACISA